MASAMASVSVESVHAGAAIFPGGNSPPVERLDALISTDFIGSG